MAYANQARSVEVLLCHSYLARLQKVSRLPTRGARQCYCTVAVGKISSTVYPSRSIIISPDYLSLMWYVDDPLVALRGSAEVRMISAAIMVLVWEALSFKLAFAKRAALADRHMDRIHSQMRR